MCSETAEDEWEEEDKEKDDKAEVNAQKSKVATDGEHRR